MEKINERDRLSKKFKKSRLLVDKITIRKQGMRLKIIHAKKRFTLKVKDKGL